MFLQIYADGASRGNPGQGAIGVVIVDECGKKLATTSQHIGIVTNNQAEYKAAIAALQMAHKLGATEVILHLDSELVARQLTGRYKVRSASLYPLYLEALELARGFRGFTAIHIAREKNAQADALANMALKKFSS